MSYDLLHEISNIDKELREIEKKLLSKETLIEINSKRNDYNNLKSSFEALVNEEKNANHKISDFEEEIKKKQEEIKCYEDSLYHTSSVKAIEGFEKNIKRLNEEIDGSEKKEYALLIRNEEISKDKMDIVRKSKNIKQEYVKLKSSYDSIHKELLLKKEDLISKRQGIVLQINEDIMTEYEDIRAKKGYGMSDIKGEICSGCGMNVPCIIISDVKKNKNLNKCPNCGRFIYIE